MQALAISGGMQNSLCISLDNRAMGCGKPPFSGTLQLTSQFTDLRIEGPTECVAAGLRHSALISQGRLYTWGDNSNGQLGTGNKKNKTQPVQVTSLSQIQVTLVSCSTGLKYSHTACVDIECNLYMWGSAYKGKLGLKASWSHEDAEDVLSPCIVDRFKAEAISCGGIHNCAVYEGRLYTWGCGSDGRLGHPEVEGHRYLYKEALPRVVQGLDPVMGVTSSYYHNLVLTG